MSNEFNLNVFNYTNSELLDLLSITSATDRNALASSTSSKGSLSGLFFFLPLIHY